MVISAIHFHFQIIANLVYQVNLQKWFSTDKIPDYTFFTEFFFTIQYIVNSLFGYIPCHAFLGIFANQVTIFTSKLAILRHDKRDALCHAVLPTYIVSFYIHSNTPNVLMFLYSQPYNFQYNCLDMLHHIRLYKFHDSLLRNYLDRYIDSYSCTLTHILQHNKLYMCQYMCQNNYYHMTPYRY